MSTRSHQRWSHFVKNKMETLRGLCYKLRMMGVPIEGPTYVYGDNMSVIYNTSKIESTLKKKSNSICYYIVREAVAMGKMLTTHCKTNGNYVNLLKKSIVLLQETNINQICDEIYL